MKRVLKQIRSNALQRRVLKRVRKHFTWFSHTIERVSKEFKPSLDGLGLEKANFWRVSKEYQQILSTVSTDPKHSRNCISKEAYSCTMVFYYLISPAIYLLYIVLQPLYFHFPFFQSGSESHYFETFFFLTLRFQTLYLSGEQ